MGKIHGLVLGGRAPAGGGALRAAFWQSPALLQCVKVGAGGFAIDVDA